MPDVGTLKARFARELTSNASLTWYNRDVSTAMAAAVPAIRTIVIGDPITYPVTAGLPVRDVNTCLKLYLLNRYGY